MKIFDRVSIPEDWIAILWENGYFNQLTLKTQGNEMIKIVSKGTRNHDSGPDFKDISIKINDKILCGDLEIHRTVNDWFNHGHHFDSAFNNVILHLIFGESKSSLTALRMNQNPVPLQIFINLSEQEVIRQLKKIQQKLYSNSSLFACFISKLDDMRKVKILEQAGLERIALKSQRFSEYRSYYSWNQIIYMGLMESLGYSKNQQAFLRLAQMVPFETIDTECNTYSDLHTTRIQALLFGVAGLLPSQDPKLKIQDQPSVQYIDSLETLWEDISKRIGINSMDRSAWHFFRLRPNNFPTRRIAGASYILKRFINIGLLEKCTRLMLNFPHKYRKLRTELESLFICKEEGYWKNHYLLNTQNNTTINSSTLIGRERAVTIIINIIIPCVHAYALETEDITLKLLTQEIIRHYPNHTSNSIIRNMTKTLKISEKKFINSSLRQQGLIHLYKNYCRRNECDLCINEIEGYNIL